ncbi:MBG domain-containing protein, partial [Prolixibacter bellariivorans]
LTQPAGLTADITKATLTVTGAAAANKVYDGTTGATISDATLSGVIGSDNVTLGNSTAGTFAQSGAGTGIAVSTSMTLGGTDAGNYTLTQPAGLTADITKATLNITADDHNKAYDGSVFNGFTVNYSGFVNGESETVLSGSPSFSGTATTATDPGTYTITPGGLTSDNYSITFTNGALEITKAKLSVIADDKHKTYGEANPVLTVTYSGFVGSDSEGDLDIPPTVSTNATMGSDVGTYPITVAGGTDNHYTFSYTSGTLTVDKEDQFITFEALPKKTDTDSDFELNALSSSGLPVTFTSSDESVAICTGTNGATVRIIGVGICTIYADQSGSTNYNAAPQVEQPLTVIKYIAGDTNGDGKIDNGEVAGDTNGDGQITPPEVAGDTNGDGKIDNGEIAGDTNSDGMIDNGEIAGDTNGDGQVTPPEVAGDT